MSTDKPGEKKQGCVEPVGRQREQKEPRERTDAGCREQEPFGLPLGKQKVCVCVYAHARSFACIKQQVRSEGHTAW